MPDKKPQPANDQSPETAETSTEPARRHVVVVMPAYNAARTLERTYHYIPHQIIDRIILVDDVSRDDTVAVAQQLGLDVIIHRQNLGYGGNQKTCYSTRLSRPGPTLSSCSTPTTSTTPLAFPSSWSRSSMARRT